MYFVEIRRRRFDLNDEARNIVCDDLGQEAVCQSLHLESRSLKQVVQLNARFISVSTWNLIISSAHFRSHLVRDRRRASRVNQRDNHILDKIPGLIPGSTRLGVLLQDQFEGKLEVIRPFLPFRPKALVGYSKLIDPCKQSKCEVLQAPRRVVGEG